jgi:pentatricopeptide repeat protein
MVFDQMLAQGTASYTTCSSLAREIEHNTLVDGAGQFDEAPVVFDRMLARRLLPRAWT